MPNDHATTPLHRGQLAGQVAELLERRIVDDETPAGTVLPSESDLCAEFGVSKPIVREAIRILAARGLVKSQQGRGTVVLAPNSESYVHAIRLMLLRSDATAGDVLRARAVLESAVAAEAATHRSAEDVETLHQHLSAFGAAIDRAEYQEVVQAHFALHAAILDAAHQPALATLLAPMTTVVTQSSVPANPFDPREWVRELHDPIVAAIEAQDPEAAAAAMRRHFTAVLDGSAFAEAATRPFRESRRVEERLSAEARDAALRG